MLRAALWAAALCACAAGLPLRDVTYTVSVRQARCGGFEAAGGWGRLHAIAIDAVGVPLARRGEACDDGDLRATYVTSNLSATVVSSLPEPHVVESRMVAAVMAPLAADLRAPLTNAVPDRDAATHLHAVLSVSSQVSGCNVPFATSTALVNGTTCVPVHCQRGYVLKTSAACEASAVAVPSDGISMTVVALVVSGVVCMAVAVVFGVVLHSRAVRDEDAWHREEAVRMAKVAASTAPDGEEEMGSCDEQQRVIPASPPRSEEKQNDGSREAPPGVKGEGWVDVPPSEEAGSDRPLVKNAYAPERDFTPTPEPQARVPGPGPVTTQSRGFIQRSQSPHRLYSASHSRGGSMEIGYSGPSPSPPSSHGAPMRNPIQTHILDPRTLRSPTPPGHSFTPRDDALRPSATPGRSHEPIYLGTSFSQDQLV